VVREVTLEKGFIERDVFDPDGILLWDNFDDAIDEDKRVPMR
jgi:hypothetical protein